MNMKRVLFHARNGHLFSLKALVERYGSQAVCNQMVMLEACKGGDLDAVKYLNYCGVELNEECFLTSVLYGSVEVAKWMVEEKKEFFETAQNMNPCIALTRYPSPEMVYWLVDEIGCEMDQEVLKQAVFKSQMEILLWLKKGLTSNKFQSWLSCDVFRLAILSGDIPILNFLKENNCPCDSDDLWMQSVFTNGNPWSVMKWLESNGYPAPSNLCARVSHQYQNRPKFIKFYLSIQNHGSECIECCEMGKKISLHSLPQFFLKKVKKI